MCSSVANQGFSQYIVCKPHSHRFRAVLQTPQGSTKPGRDKESFGQYSQADGVTVGMVLCRLRVGLDDPSGPLPTHHMLYFCDNKYGITCSADLGLP